MQGTAAHTHAALQQNHNGLYVRQTVVPPQFLERVGWQVTAAITNVEGPQQGCVLWVRTLDEEV